MGREKRKYGCGSVIVLSVLFVLFIICIKSGSDYSPSNRQHPPPKPQTPASDDISQPPIEKKVLYKTTATNCRLLPDPNSNTPILRIPNNTKLRVFEKRAVQQGRLKNNWYRVKYNGKEGWVSGWDMQEGEELVITSFGGEAKNKFKEWALKNTAVTWFEYQSDWQIWVKLGPEKYTTKENVEKIALSLARYYRIQTGYNKPIVVTVWHPYETKWVAKGQLP